jgi:predicted transcriptional regulator
MGNSLSTLETFFEDIFSNLFGSNNSNSNTSVAEEEESVFVKDMNITPNQNLDNVNTAASGFNSDMSTKQTSINTQLQQINFYDNSIKSNNELLQLIANTSNKQLQDLYRKELEVATKSSLVNNLNKYVVKQKHTISLLVVILVLILLLVIPLVMLITKRISPGLFCTLVVIDVVLIVLLIAWRNNILYLRSFVTTLGSDLESTAETVAGDVSSASEALQARINSFNQIVRADVYGSEADYQAQYCCPTTSTTEETILTLPVSEITPSIQPLPGFFYNDGSAPSQLLVPDNTNSLSEEQFNSQILYPDFAIENRRKSLIKNRSRPILSEETRLIGKTINTINQ